ncbi:MAG: carboxypeptidase, partial [Alphaproteobacteria bacterium 65-37]
MKNEPRIDADEVLGGIVEWVSIESPSHDAKSVNKVVDHVEGQFKDLGLKLERIPGRDGFGDILEAKTPWGEGKGILVLAHLDTVHPLGMIEKELKVRREGDSIFGPGIYDMKAGGYIAYYALRHLIRQGKRTKLPVTFLFIPEEEVGSPTSRSRIEEAARGHKYALVMEPGRDGDKVVTSRKGVGRFTLSVKGRAAHAGVRHQDGRSAILEMARQIERIEGKTDYARGITCNVGLIRGGTGVNVTPSECVADVDLRVPSQQLAEEMTHWFLNLEPIGKDVELTVEGGMNRPPYQKDAGITALFEKAQAIYREIGK